MIAIFCTCSSLQCWTHKFCVGKRWRWYGCGREAVKQGRRLKKKWEEVGKKWNACNRYRLEPDYSVYWCNYKNREWHTVAKIVTSPMITKWLPQTWHIKSKKQSELEKTRENKASKFLLIGQGVFLNQLESLYVAITIQRKYMITLTKACSLCVQLVVVVHLMLNSWFEGSWGASLSLLHL